ncbi:MAG: thioredoxin domain-containing protein [Gammaproteobacteria bacterium]|nr:thioredoxin domain-containing protein [Gammaproteobacteria bacterium]
MIESGDFDAAIERGIGAYIERQRALGQAKQQQEKATLAKNVRPVAVETDHIYGDPKAPITIVEYSDFECPYCKTFHPTVKKVVDANPGKVNWVYRHFPLGFHNPGAQKQAEATECAAVQGGDDAFWKMTDLIYERTTSNGKGFAIDKLVPLAEEIGLDSATFKTCLDSGKMEARVLADLKNGEASGITGTPATILIHTPTSRIASMSGAVPMAQLQAIIDQLEP